MLDLSSTTAFMTSREMLNPGGLRDFVLNLSTQKTFTFTSQYKKLEKTSVKALDKLIGLIDELPE